MSASETGLLPGEIVKALVAYGEACAVNGYVCARKTTQPDEITKSLDGRVNTRASLEAAILAELNSRAPSPAASSDPGPCGCSVCTCGATDALALSHAALLAEVERLKQMLRLPDSQRRQIFITSLVEGRGYFNRLDIMHEFAVSTPQASTDIAQWLESNGAKAVYNKSRKRYERAARAALEQSQP